MSTPIVTNQVSPPGREVSPLCESTHPTDDSDGQLGKTAPVFYYFEAGEPPKKLQIPTKNNFFSFIGDCDLLSEAEFVGHSLKIYDCSVKQFMPIPLSAFWRYPSPRTPFFIIKVGHIEDEDCPDLQDLISSLLDDDRTHSETWSQMQSSSPFPLSPPPPAQPFYPCESPIRVEFAEKEVQTAEEAQTAEEVRPRKCKRVHSELEVGVPAPKAAFELNLHIHDHGRGNSLLKKGTGDNAADPIII